MATLKLMPVLLAAISLTLDGCSSSSSGNAVYSGSLGTATTLLPLPQSHALNGTAIGVGLAYSGLTTDVGGNLVFPTVSALYGPSSTAISVLTDASGDLAAASIRLPDMSTGTPYQYGPTASGSSSYFLGSTAGLTSPPDATPPAVITYTDSTGNNHIKAVTAYGSAPFSYQFYGEWNVEHNSTSGFNGFFSAGIATTTALPTTGTASYAGQSIGEYIDAGGKVYSTAANLNATADFGARTLSFATTGTVVDQANAVPPPAVANSNLDLSGTLSVSGVGFSGTVKTSGTSTIPLSGTATGSFYGPGIDAATAATLTSVVGSPAEIGGSYQVSGTGGKMIGAFGGLVK